MQVADHGVEPAYEFGDRAVVGARDVRPAPGGVFLYRDGDRAVLANMQVLPSAGEPKVRITRKGAETVDLPLDEVRIIGRAKGRIQRA